MATQTLFTLSPALRGPLNGFITSTFLLPVGSTKLTVTSNISAADLADASKSLTLGIQRFKQATLQWATDAEFTWQGGGLDKSGNPNTQSPVMIFDVGGLDGQNCRGIITIPIAITVGAVVSSS